MNLTLINKTFEPFGIFGELMIEDGETIAVTLQHAYPTEVPGIFSPKIPEGSYLCRRGTHRLESMTHTFETFEVKGVYGHTNILFHVGNYPSDSSGCILLGERAIISGPNPMITNSREAFERFMILQRDVNEFTLTVIDGEDLTAMNHPA